MNFRRWQSACIEFIFVDKWWPDFDKGDLEAAVAEFRRRERRYGAAAESLYDLSLADDAHPLGDGAGAAGSARGLSGRPVARRPGGSGGRFDGLGVGAREDERRDGQECVETGRAVW